MRLIYRRAAASVAMLSVVLNIACSSWQVPALGPQAIVEELRPKAVQVRRADGTRFVLRQPTLAGDSLLGLQAGAPTSVYLAPADQLAVRRFSAGKTALLVGGVAGGIFVVALIGFAIDPIEM